MTSRLLLLISPRGESRESTGSDAIYKLKLAKDMGIGLVQSSLCLPPLGNATSRAFV